jgi:TatD DNase family protein
MYFICRDAHDDFMDLIHHKRKMFTTGVVSSFQGTFEQMQEMVEAGLYLGISCRSLTTPEMCDVVKEIPLENLVIESGCPDNDI